MPNQNRSSNSFSGGLNLDFDLLTIDETSYIASQNGRISFTDQSTSSWVNTKGNSLAITITSTFAGNYTPIGYAVLNNLLILFLVGDNGSDEIGLVTFDENGDQNSYKTLMNDNSFTDKFDFQLGNQIEARAIFENKNCHRVYWVDGVESDSNPPRAFTFELTSGNENIASNYDAVSLSPHSVDQQTDFIMGIIKYQETINGGIPAGQYVYSYRLLTADGYATPWYPPTIPLFVTQDSINGTNWNEYEMEGTETFVNSGKGNRLVVKGVDTRYQEIEMSYTYYTANGAPFEANIFVRTEITGDTMIIDHISNTGEPINPLEIPAQQTSFTGAKTLEIKDNVLYQGNLNERFFRLTDVEQENLLSGVTIEPSFRLMRSDEEELITSNPPPSDIQDTFGQEPLTHQVPKTGLSTKRLNQSHTEDYTVNNDYVNYKGTQVSHQYSGYFRGEAYRFGIVFFDEVGNPSFVYHLADITIDDQHDDSISWDRLKADGTIQNGSFTYGDTFRSTSDGTEVEDPVLNGEDGTGALNRLRILGFKISGIDITNIKSRIRGFKIVRAERDKQILGQGLIMPCVKEQLYTTPLPSPTQNWLGTNGTIPMIPSDAGTEKLLWPLQSDDFYHLEKDNAASEGDEKFKLRPNTSCMYMPDIDFDISRYPTVQSIDRIRLVGQCSQHEMPGDDDPIWRQYMEYNNYVVQKLDWTAGTFHYTAGAPYPRFGEECSIVEMRLADYGGLLTGKFDNYQGTLDFYNSTGIEAGVDTPVNNEPHAFFQPNNDFGSSDLYAHGKNRTMFIFHNNFNASSSAMSYDDTAGQGLASYFIANYRRPNASPYGGLTGTSMEQTQFISTGHFQPVNNTLFSDPNIINDVEIYGGDCYLDYFGFARLYGILLDNTFQDNDSYSDYGIGHYFPLESDFHHMLRQASNIGSGNPMWPDIGFKPAAAFYGTDTTTAWIQNGLFLSWDYTGNNYGTTVVADSNVEEFNINGVLSLAAVLRIYFGLFSRFKEIDEFPLRWRYSDVKIYGEIIDRFRIFLANDFTDLKGQYGQITSSEYIFNQIYSFQMKAFGRLRAFDRALLESQNLGTLTTGTGGKLDGIDYINTMNGNQHQWSLVSSGKALYWIDVYKRALCRFAQDGFVSLSDDRSVHSFANKELGIFQGFDTPVLGKGVTTIFDSDNNEIIFSLINQIDNPTAKINTQHIIFNEDSDKFVDQPLFNSRFGASYNDNVYWFTDVIGTDNQLYKHNSGARGNFFGTVTDARVTIVVNNTPILAKVFDNVRMNINDGVINTLKEIVMETQEQFEVIPIAGDTRFRYLEQILRGPLRKIDQNDRMRGKWIKLTFVFDNASDEKVIFTNLMTTIRISNRT